VPATTPKRPRSRDQMVAFAANTPESIEAKTDELARLSVPQALRAQVTVDLVVGDNRVNHNLGRRPRHVSLMPTVADATFAWSVSSRDERQVVITVIGVDQPQASVEVS
jgi:hypothetical protein